MSAFGAMLQRVLEWLLKAIGFDSTYIPDLLAEIVVWLMVAVVPLLFKVVRRFVKSLPRRFAGRLRRPSRRAGGREPNPFELALERAYLEWLAEEIEDSSWHSHEAPYVRTEGVTAERPGWKKRIRTVLFRHNPLDYLRNPGLRDAELSLRAGFGRRRRIRDLARELRKFRKIVVLGDPGSGKSVCLRQLAYDLAERGLRAPSLPATLPVLVGMGAYDGWIEGPTRRPAPVLEFLKEALLSHESIREAPNNHPLAWLARQLERLLGEGRLTLVFDALDEMPQDGYAERYQELKLFMKAWESRGNRFVFSCRSLDHDESFQVGEVFVEPFSQKRVGEYLRLHVGDLATGLLDRIGDDEAMFEMLGSPFFLQALAYINQPEPSGGKQAEAGAPQLPVTRGALLRAFVDALLEREAAVKQKEELERVPGGLATLRRFLSDLGFALQLGSEGGTAVRTETLGGLWIRYPEWQRLLSIARRARILGKRREKERLPEIGGRGLDVPERVELVHHRLQEFFAAEELARRLEAGETLQQYLEDIWWQETVILAIGIVPDPRPVLAEVLGQRDEVLEGVAPEALERRPLSKHAALFVAAEAAGQLGARLGPTEREGLLARLGELVAKGGPLDRVRALRSLRYLAGKDCLQPVELGLRDSSAWVRATALRTLFRLDLHNQEPRSVLVTFLRRRLIEALVPLRAFQKWDLEVEVTAPSPWARGVVLGLWKEPGARLLAALSVVVWLSALVLYRVAWSLFWARTGVLLAGVFAGLLLSAPVLAADAGILQGQKGLARLVVASALDYGAVLACLYLADFSEASVVCGFLFLLGLGAIAVHDDHGAVKRHRAVLRALLLLITFVLAGAWASFRWVALALALWQLASLCTAGWSFVKSNSLAGLRLVLGISVALAMSGAVLASPSLMFWLGMLLAIAVAVSFPWLDFKFPESWLVESARGAVLAGRQRSYRDFEEYFVYACKLIGDWNTPHWVRERYALSLVEQPVARLEYARRLMELSQGYYLPERVNDAVLQAVDAIERRARRVPAQGSSSSSLEMEFETPPQVLAGRLLRPYVALALAFSLLGAVAAWRVLPSLGAWGSTILLASRMELVLAGVALVWVLATLGRVSEIRRSFLVLGAGLLGVALSQSFVAGLDYSELDPQFAFENGATWAAADCVRWIVTAYLGLLSGLLAHVLYMLDTDLPAELGTPGRSLLVSLTFLVFLSSAASGWPLGEWLSTRNLTAPAIEASGEGWRVRWLQQGRLVRVALVGLQKGRLRVPLQETFPSLEKSARDREPGAFLPERMLATDPQVRGEQWIYTNDQGSRAWQVLPGGCLAAHAAGLAEVQLALGAECLSPGRYCLVAIDYGPLRSPVLIKAMASHDSLVDFLVRGFRGGKRFLDETLSLSSRAAWSEPFSVPQRQ
ncbi:MAG TPA: NACHT domain-containing protein [Thermoanaerobaculia bacterium]|nr:NACHT domain-containing protein [Thermoanaerobaculia bacterium]